MRRRRRLRSRSAPVRLSSANARRSSAHASSDATATCLQAPACVSSYVGARARIGAPGQAGCLLLHSGKARVWQRAAALPHAAEGLSPCSRMPAGPSLLQLQEMLIPVGEPAMLELESTAGIVNQELACDCDRVKCNCIKHCECSTTSS